MPKQTSKDPRIGDLVHITVPLAVLAVDTEIRKNQFFFNKLNDVAFQQHINASRTMFDLPNISPSNFTNLPITEKHIQSGDGTEVIGFIKSILDESFRIEIKQNGVHRIVHEIPICTNWLELRHHIYDAPNTSTPFIESNADYFNSAYMDIFRKNVTPYDETYGIDIRESMCFEVIDIINVNTGRYRLKYGGQTTLVDKKTISISILEYPKMFGVIPSNCFFSTFPIRTSNMSHMHKITSSPHYMCDDGLWKAGLPVLTHYLKPIGHIRNTNDKAI